MCKELNIEDESFYDGDRPVITYRRVCNPLYRDNNKCYICRRCTAVCEKTQGVGVIGPNERGFTTLIGSPFNMGLGDTSCVSCGQCIAVCPTGALSEKV